MQKAMQLLPSTLVHASGSAVSLQVRGRDSRRSYRSRRVQGALLRTSNCTGNERPSASFSVITTFSPAANDW